MSNEMNVQEIIAELDKITSLCNQIVDIEEKMDNVVSIDNAKELEDATQKTLKELEDYEESQEKNLADVASKLPQNFPPDPPQKILGIKPWNSKSKIICSAISLFLIYVSIVGLFIGMFSNVLAFYSFALIGITIFMNIKFPVSEAVHYMEVYESLNNYEDLIKSWESEFDKQYPVDLNEKKYNAFRAYDEKFLIFVENCDKRFEEVKIRHEEEIEKIGEKNKKRLDDFFAQGENILNELRSTTLIPEDLYNDAWRISSMLKQKRADSLKEAINLALDEKRKEEEEITRREEARRQEAILEQQARDSRMHNEAMQRAAEEEARATREHNAAMERAAQAQATAAEAQAREAQKQTRMASQQANDARRVAQERCSKCRNRGTCSVHGDAAIGCPSYRPR